MALTAPGREGAESRFGGGGCASASFRSRSGHTARATRLPVRRRSGLNSLRRLSGTRPIMANAIPSTRPEGEHTLGCQVEAISRLPAVAPSREKPNRVVPPGPRAVKAPVVACQIRPRQGPDPKGRYLVSSFSSAPSPNSMELETTRRPKFDARRTPNVSGSLPHSLGSL